MKLTNPLNAILSSETKIKVMRLFCQAGGESSGRQIAKLINAGTTPVRLALRDLYNEGALEQKKFGTAYAFSLNKKNWVVRDILIPMFRAEQDGQRKLWERITSQIGKSGLNQEIGSVTLFGSVASGQERPTSDIDLLVVVKDRSGKKDVQNMFAEMMPGVIKDTGLSLDVHIYTQSELKTKIGGTPFVKEAITRGKVIMGSKLSELT